MIPSGAAREVLVDVIKAMVKNPDELADLARTAGKLMENEEILEALVKNPEALEAVLKSGPDAVEELVSKGDEALELIDDLDVDGVKSILDEGDSFIKELVSEPFDEPGNLKPNIRYTTGEFDYLYETDSMGRICKFETDDLQFTSRDARLHHNPDTPGKLGNDHAGHLAGDRFGGSSELDNLVSQSQNVNLSEYKRIENQWAKAIEEGKNVTVNVDVKYVGDSMRPTQFNIEYTIDGTFFSQNIIN